MQKDEPDSFRDFTARGMICRRAKRGWWSFSEKPGLWRVALPASREDASFLRQPQLMTLLQAATSGRRLRWSEGLFVQLADPIEKDAHAW
jgi:hypothetical protein